MRVRPGGDATVLIQPVHHQDQPLTLCAAGLGGLLQHPQQVSVPGGSRQRRQFLFQQLGQLLQHDLGEGLPGVLGTQPGGDEKRHHPHPGRRVQHERRHQRRLTRPRRRLPPHIRAPAGLGTVRRQLPQLRLTADQLRRRDTSYLLAVCRPYRQPPRPHIDGANGVSGHAAGLSMRAPGPLGDAGRPRPDLSVWRRDMIWSAGGGQPRDCPGW